MLQSATSFHEGHPPQQPFDAAVVIPTICRPSLLRAAKSLFRQVGVERLQLLIGIDTLLGDASVIDEVLAARPAEHAVTFINLGYSTSIRHGGVHPAVDTGALRTILTYCANSRYVAYLDDDNWVDETHIARLLEAIQGQDWAFTLRWFVDPDTLEPLAIDRWESVGPGRGIYTQQLGGFVDPNCLMIDKLKCDPAIRFWALPLPGEWSGTTADRSVFEMLRRRAAVRCTNVATAYYVMGAADPDRAARLAWVRELHRCYGRAALTADGVLPGWGQPICAPSESGR
jgi:hypothetical protein